MIVFPRGIRTSNIFLCLCQFGTRCQRNISFEVVHCWREAQNSTKKLINILQTMMRCKQSHSYFSNVSLILFITMRIEGRLNELFSILPYIGIVLLATLIMQQYNPTYIVEVSMFWVKPKCKLGVNPLVWFEDTSALHGLLC